MDDAMQLKDDVEQLLLRNLRQGYSKIVDAEYCYIEPSSEKYPFQFFWDTCIHVIILCSIDRIDIAKKTFRSLFRLQEPNGRIGHMIFWNRIFPTTWRDIFQSAPAISNIRPHMSALIQPSLLAHALQRIHQASGDAAYVREMLPQLHNYYQWLLGERMHPTYNLIQSISPFESGIDWKPSFDIALGRSPAQASTRLYWQVVKNDMRNFFHRYNINRIIESEHFLVAETTINTLLAVDCAIMAELTEHYSPELTGMYQETATIIEESILTHLYNEEHSAFFDLNLLDGKQLKVQTATQFLPLLLSNTQHLAATVAAHLDNPYEFATEYPIPSVAVSEPAFDPGASSYLWRGPTWILINWFLARCCAACNLTQYQERIVKSTEMLIAQSGFREYYNPFTGVGGGQTDFTWGGLLIDMRKQLNR